MAIKAFLFDAYGTLFDVNSLVPAVEARFPDQGDLITQLWRQRQLESTWQRAAMGRYVDFSTITRGALLAAVDAVMPQPDAQQIEELMEEFNRLKLYPDVMPMLDAMRNHRLAVLSNGSPSMLKSLLEHTGIAERFEATISTDLVHSYKPHPHVYRAAATALGLSVHELVLVSSSGSDIAGARQVGIKTVKVQRQSIAHLRSTLQSPPSVPTSHSFFTVLRTQHHNLVGTPDLVCAALSDLPSLTTQLHCIPMAPAAIAPISQAHQPSANP